MRIKKQYFITLGLVLLLANQVFIQFSLLNAQQDSRIINIAGKQRLNTQKMFSALVDEELNIEAFSHSIRHVSFCTRRINSQIGRKEMVSNEL